MCAFLPTLGYGEMFLLLVLAFAFYAHELPQAMSTIVRTVVGWIGGEDYR